MSEGVRRSCNVTPKKTWPMNKHTGFDKLKLEDGPMESVGARIVGMKSLISCMTQNIPYRIVLFIWNMI